MKIIIETLFFGVYRVSSGDRMESEGFETEEEARDFFDDRNGYTTDDQEQWIEKRKIETLRIDL